MFGSPAVHVIWPILASAEVQGILDAEQDLGNIITEGIARQCAVYMPGMVGRD